MLNQQTTSEAAESAEQRISREYGPSIGTHFVRNLLLTALGSIVVAKGCDYVTNTVTPAINASHLESKQRKLQNACDIAPELGSKATFKPNREDGTEFPHMVMELPHQPHNHVVHLKGEFIDADIVVFEDPNGNELLDPTEAPIQFDHSEQVRKFFEDLAREPSSIAEAQPSTLP